MKIAKTLSTLSLAFALQAGALVAATVVLAPTDAAAAVSKKKAPKKAQKKAPARGKKKSNFGLPGNGDGLQDKLDPKNPPRDGGNHFPPFTPPGANLPGDNHCEQFRNCR